MIVKHFGFFCHWFHKKQTAWGNVSYYQYCEICNTMVEITEIEYKKINKKRDAARIEWRKKEDERLRNEELWNSQSHLVQLANDVLRALGVSKKDL